MENYDAPRYFQYVDGWVINKKGSYEVITKIGLAFSEGSIKKFENHNYVLISEKEFKEIMKNNPRMFVSFSVKDSEKAIKTLEKLIEN